MKFALIQRKRTQVSGKLNFTVRKTPSVTALPCHLPREGGLEQLHCAKHNFTFARAKTSPKILSKVNPKACAPAHAFFQPSLVSSVAKPRGLKPSPLGSEAARERKETIKYHSPSSVTESQRDAPLSGERAAICAKIAYRNLTHHFVVHRLVATRSQNGSDIINVIHSRSAVSLP